MEEVGYRIRKGKRISKSICLVFLLLFFSSCRPNLERSILEPLTLYNGLRCRINPSSCPPNGSFTLGGTIIGLTATGLILSSGTTPPQTVSPASGATSFQFTNLVASGSNYAVVVTTQPAGLTCTVASGSGTITAAVNSVAVSCVPTGTFTVGGTITGLTATGLVLSSGTTPPQTVSPALGATSFQFTNVVASGSAYAVTVSTQPAGLNCTVASGSGTISASVTNIAINCTESTIAAPIFSPVPGHYSTPQNLSLSTTTLGASIYLTTNGSDPTTASMLYSDTAFIWQQVGVTIKAIAVKSGLPNSPIATAEYSYSTLKTGQTASYAANDDGIFQQGVARSYTDNNDGTISDNATSLVWQKCLIGQTTASCIGSGTTMDWAIAQTTCSGLSTAGKSWRLPTYLELQTLGNYGANNPSMNSAFPNGAFTNWTITPVTTNAANAYSLNFTNMVSTSTPKNDNTLRTRCVSGSNRNSIANFVDNGNGTILDKLTGLTWQKCSIGQTNDATCTGAGTARNNSQGLTDCTGLALAGRTWRLPNISELFSVLDTSVTVQPPINLTFFPNTPAGANYWTSTTVQGTATDGYLVSFNNAISTTSLKTGNNLIRCVSGP